MTEQIILSTAGIGAALNQLSEFYSQIDALELKKEELKNAILTDELLDQLEDIDVEFNGRAEIANERIKELTALIKKNVIDHGATVKGEYLMAVRNKGRVTWNTKKLDGFAVAYPALLELRKEGKASCTIRKR